MSIERESIREQLALLRSEMESVVVEVTTTPSGNGLTRAVALQKDMMDLLQYFVSVGGKVLAAPLYRANQIGLDNTVRMRIRKHKIHQLVNFGRTYQPDEIPAWLANYPGLGPNQGIELKVHAVKDKARGTKALIRLVGAPNEPGEDTHVWKWLFADLSETEDRNTIVRDRSRWGWAGKFCLGPELEREEGGDLAAAEWDLMDPDRLFELV